MERYDEDGFILDDYGQAWGECNSCGDEVHAEDECCDDGEVVPPERPLR